MQVVAVVGFILLVLLAQAEQVVVELVALMLQTERLVQLIAVVVAVVVALLVQVVTEDLEL
jgi:hypothetical protein